MICKNPYVKASTPCGDQLIMKVDTESRLANTPFGCGQCLPCRINKGRTWTMRIVMESCLYDNNTFLTLTYEDEKLPRDDQQTPILYPYDTETWLKRFRKEYGIFRYFLVGEYGNLNERPHYHAILFGVDPHAASPLVDKTWKEGFNYIGEVNPKSAAYIAGYCLKKMTRASDDRLGNRPPEYMRSSRLKGGIGLGYLKQMANKANNDKNCPKYPLVSLKIGPKSYPIGQYLAKKWIEMVKVDPKLLDERLYDYQEEVFSKFMFKENSYIHELLLNMQAQVTKVERRYQNRKNKRKDTF